MTLSASKCELWRLRHGVDSLLDVLTLLFFYERSCTTHYIKLVVCFIVVSGVRLFNYSEIDRIYPLKELPGCLATLVT
jgi:hypothetical protein